MEIDLSGRTALITGGSRGLGFAMAQNFVRAGAQVMIAARRPDVVKASVEELRSAGNGTVTGYAADVASAEGIQSLWERIQADFDGRVDILVNNAGKSQAGPFEDQTDEIWQDDLELKLMAAIRLCRFVLPGMRERSWGRIVNVLNTAARAPGARSVPTSVSRAAGLALTKALASEYAPHNICINAILIGLIVTDQVERMRDRADPELSIEEFVARAGARLPMGRMGEAEECANLVTFLASAQASYVTGCAINMDGGLSPVP